jgi:hypothetical protein
LPPTTQNARTELNRLTQKKTSARRSLSKRSGITLRFIV